MNDNGSTTDVLVDSYVARMEVDGANPVAVAFTDHVLRAFIRDLSAYDLKGTDTNDADVADLIANMVMTYLDGSKFEEIGDRAQTIITETVERINEVITTLNDARG